LCRSRAHARPKRGQKTGKRGKCASRGPPTPESSWYSASLQGRTAVVARGTCSARLNPWAGTGACPYKVTPANPAQSWRAGKVQPRVCCRGNISRMSWTLHLSTARFIRLGGFLLADPGPDVPQQLFEMACLRPQGVQRCLTCGAPSPHRSPPPGVIVGNQGVSWHAPGSEPSSGPTSTCPEPEPASSSRPTSSCTHSPPAAPGATSRACNRVPGARVSGTEAGTPAGHRSQPSRSCSVSAGHGTPPLFMFALVNECERSR